MAVTSRNIARALSTDKVRRDNGKMELLMEKGWGGGGGILHLLCKINEVVIPFAPIGSF